MMDFKKAIKEHILTKDCFQGFWLMFVWILMLVSNQGVGFTAGVNQFMFLLAISLSMTHQANKRIWKDNNQANHNKIQAINSLVLAILWTINVWPTIVSPWMWYDVCIAVGVWLNFMMFLTNLAQEKM